VSKLYPYDPDYAVSPWGTISDNVLYYHGEGINYTVCKYHSDNDTPIDETNVIVISVVSQIDKKFLLRLENNYRKIKNKLKTN